jgi:hypothetical protein
MRIFSSQSDFFSSLVSDPVRSLLMSSSSVLRLDRDSNGGHNSR